MVGLSASFESFLPFSAKASQGLPFWSASFWKRATQCSALYFVLWSLPSSDGGPLRYRATLSYTALDFADQWIGACGDTDRTEPTFAQSLTPSTHGKVIDDHETAAVEVQPDSSQVFTYSKRGIMQTRGPNLVQPAV